MKWVARNNKPTESHHSTLQFLSFLQNFFVSFSWLLWFYGPQLHWFGSVSKLSSAASSAASDSCLSERALMNTPHATFPDEVKNKPLEGIFAAQEPDIFFLRSCLQPKGDSILDQIRIYDIFVRWHNSKCTFLCVLLLFFCNKRQSANMSIIRWEYISVVFKDCLAAGQMLWTINAPQQSTWHPNLSIRVKTLWALVNRLNGSFSKLLI